MRRSWMLRLASLPWVLAMLACGARVDAAITVRRNAPVDQFFFHGNYSGVPFAASEGFGLQLYNCAGGEMPVFIADRQPIVACGYDAATGYALADLVYAAALPSGACKDHGSSCYYRDQTVPDAHEGIRFLRVRYARRGYGNRVWLDSYGDLSRATQANMLILITIDGGPRAVLQDTFVAIPGGGWFSGY